VTGIKNIDKEKEKDMSGSKRNGEGVREMENNKLLEKYFTCLFLLSKPGLFLQSHLCAFSAFEGYISETSFECIK